jgi:hypothetical protein
VAQEILTAAGGPVAVEKLVYEVLARKATVSKNPRQLVRSKLREFTGRVVQVLAVPLAYKGARYRIRLDQGSINQGSISAENFEYFLPPSFSMKKIQLLNCAVAPIPFQIKTTSHEKKKCCLARIRQKKRG